MARTPLNDRLPDFPWDSLANAKARARAHPDGLVDLSVGTPVDEVAPSIQLALAENAAAPGYPQTTGTPELRAEITEWMRRRYHVSGLSDDAVLPVIGTKEAIAWLPTLLGLQGQVVIPEIAYPTYEVGARLAGCEILRADSLTAIGPGRPDLIYINSPSNPTGKVLGADHLRKLVDFARERDVIIAADECYLSLGWDDENPPISLLDDRLTDGDHTNLLVLNSLSKSSNLASYRAGFIAGDEQLVRELLEVRKHAGLMMPGPIQHAMLAALRDDDQEHFQKLRYAARRAKLLPALIDAGFRIDNSEAGLYLWATRDEDCRDTVDYLAGLGILVAPGEFYGPRGQRHVRISLTESDERIDAAVGRLAQH
ncbi:succinyldiaminopimelate transaminase [Corynebacterium yudongzhengii]|uniref:Succinyldiaminopimelate transaminase n=1 Tax=Corynebacterium yudongzhengii TaxID=2080740 RepID=A0A2U1T477_9CORY|nr:succinyldiaminopimelate transaminase [Corynebacterium yudongzhengii]AWB82170.1 succinyldiaminopimelate transaminase [Corynebacterium yudongzhengii]PWC00801.1 succinyldiaminopimelate transaminase [Corynebacterium yudongzhengii]